LANLPSPAEAAPFFWPAYLILFADSSPMPFVNGIKATRQRIAARDDDERTTFLRERGFSKTERTKIIEAVLIDRAGLPRVTSTLCKA
jgi:hypothetical protein